MQAVLVDILGKALSYRLSLIAGLISMHMFVCLFSLVFSNSTFCSAKIKMIFLPLNHFPEVREREKKKGFNNI